MQSALVLQHPRDAAALGDGRTRARGLRRDRRALPALGGIVIGHEVARASAARDPRRAAGQPAGRCGVAFTLSPEDSVIVVRTSSRQASDARNDRGGACAAGATVVAAAAIVDRSGDSADLGVRLPARCCASHLPTYDPAACPLCAQGRAGGEAGIEELTMMR